MKWIDGKKSAAQGFAFPSFYMKNSVMYPLIGFLVQYEMLV